ncbi:MAG TPA: hypothetical protein VFH73_16945 [Polyangia bacterium]|nr:hypothetical protein [Polyangia bacterium]
MIGDVRRLNAVVLASAALLLGCSSSPGAGASGGTGGATGSPDAIVGAFVVELKAGFSAVSGSVSNGPRPEAVILKVVDEVGGCRLRTPRVPFCNIPCGGDAVCADDDKCLPSPKSQDLGLVRVKGLGAAEFSMDPVKGMYSPSADVMLPSPPCPEGAPIEIQTGGGAYRPFVLRAKGISPLTVAGADPIPLTDAEPLQLRWTPPGDASVSRIAVRLDLSHHGGKKGQIDCDVPDNGSFDIPAALVGKLIALGTAGFPTAYVTRVSTGEALIEPGRVTLEVSSSIDRPLQVPGVVSCMDTSECPPGKTCQVDRTCK